MAAPMEGVAVRSGLPNKGKALFAVREFSKDEVVFEEQPLVSSQFSWNAMYKYLACDHCMKSLETAEDMARRLSENPALVLPYPQCCQVNKDQHTVCPHCQVMYCGTSCRDTAWLQYHQSLCMGPSTHDQEHPLNRLQEIWRNMHYPPETTSIMLIARMICMVRQAKDKETIKATFAQFCRATVNEEEEIAHKLLGQEFKDQQELLRPTLAEALFEEEVQQWFTPGGFQSLLALIGTNGQGIGTSSVGVWAHNCEKLAVSEEEKATLDAFIDQLYMDMDKVSGQFLNCEGSGLYVLQSACNHSCVPNAEITFPYNDSTLVVKALDKIQEGEEIFISYLDECDRERSRHSRHKILRENYLFTCSCAKCESEAEDPDVTSEEEDDECEDNEMEDDDQ